MSPAELLRNSGEALYGPQWQPQLSDALGVNQRQIRRWLSGQYDPPAGVWRELEQLCRQRSWDLYDMVEPLAAAAAAET